MPAIREIRSNALERVRGILYSFPIVMLFFLLVWLILGAAMIFNDHECEIGKN